MHTYITLQYTTSHYITLHYTHTHTRAHMSPSCDRAGRKGGRAPFGASAPLQMARQKAGSTWGARPPSSRGGLEPAYTPLCTDLKSPKHATIHVHISSKRNMPHLLRPDDSSSCNDESIRANAKPAPERIKQYAPRKPIMNNTYRREKRTGP